MKSTSIASLVLLVSSVFFFTPNASAYCFLVVLEEQPEELFSTGCCGLPTDPCGVGSYTVGADMGTGGDLGFSPHNSFGQSMISSGGNGAGGAGGFGGAGGLGAFGGGGGGGGGFFAIPTPNGNNPNPNPNPGGNPNPTDPNNPGGGGNTPNPASTPEPATLAIWGIGGLAIAARRMIRRR